MANDLSGTATPSQDVAKAVGVTPDGVIVVVGEAPAKNGTTGALYLRELYPNGSAVSTFNGGNVVYVGPGVFGTGCTGLVVRDIEVRPRDAYIYVVGESTGCTTPSSGWVLSIRSDGAINSGFGSNGNGVSLATAFPGSSPRGIKLRSEDGLIYMTGLNPGSATSTPPNISQVLYLQMAQ